LHNQISVNISICLILLKKGIGIKDLISKYWYQKVILGVNIMLGSLSEAIEQFD